MKLSIPHINKEDIKQVSKVLNNGWISTSSQMVKIFEHKLAKFCGSKYSIALNSGTSAIHLGLKILGVDNKSEVLVPSLTFIATVNPILYLGAKPIFFDVDDFHNLKIDDVISFIKKKTKFENNKTINKKTKKIIRVIIVTHMWGRSCDVFKLKKFCKKRNIKILEDAAEALGSFIKKNKNYHCGNVGDLGCLSFNANKIITTGSGGAIITNNKKFYEKAQYLANQAKDDTFNYIHNEIGFNYKMNSMSAALGLSQLKRIKKKIQLRKMITNRYLNNFKNMDDIYVLSYPSGSVCNYWMNIIYFKKLNFQLTNVLSSKLSKHKIETRRVWRPLNLQKYLKDFKSYKIINAPKFYFSSLCVPSDDKMSISDVDKISKYIKNFVKKLIKVR
ncbi:aminotransferase class I/II-fold pyridoxal phosphate-dependent enzyme [Candidatus Pelagibacter bacterium nBUS_49]|uniref:aminotransferase class I/II-fold pyridoxal phosphate-dependent enzyme n=1 Tax=Candidatus Pelagibacter bacterium nBUS_49 TaxID=3374196 RepID=UPI003EBD4D69